LKHIAYILEKEFGIKYNPRSLSSILKELASSTRRVRGPTLEMKKP
jgi:hypothetical protein